MAFADVFAPRRIPILVNLRDLSHIKVKETNLCPRVVHTAAHNAALIRLCSIQRTG
jgi:hypothetical protein